MKIGIGNSEDVIATLDTGASCNVLPINVYEKSGLTDMKALKQKVQLADRTMMRPLGYLEDVGQDRWHRDYGKFCGDALLTR